MEGSKVHEVHERRRHLEVVALYRDFTLTGAGEMAQCLRVLAMKA